MRIYLEEVMAIFRDFKSLSDRSYKDRLGHWQLKKEAMRRNIEIIAEETIIAKRGDEFVMVPIKEIKEFRFIYQEKSPQTGQSGGDVKPGDIIGQSKDKEGKTKGGAVGQQGSKSGPGGDEPGIEMYEKVSIPYDELLDIIFDDIELPEVERKKLKDIISRTKRKIKGHRKKGIWSRLDKKKTAIERIKRKKAAERGRRTSKNKKFPFHREDFRYKRVVEKEEKYSNAAIYFVRDVSWSMGETERYLTKIFFLLFYLFIRAKYKNVDLVYIGHHTQAKEEKNEKQFFNRVSSGGTHISSGYEKTLEIIEKRHNPEHWNIYVFQCSDGDNAYADNDKALELAKKICEISNLFGYCEVKPGQGIYSSIIELLDKEIDADNFATAKISNKEDIYPVFKSILRKERVRLPK